MIDRQNCNVGYKRNFIDRSIKWSVLGVLVLPFFISTDVVSEGTSPRSEKFIIDEAMLDQMIEQMPALPGNVGPLADVPIPADNPMTTAKIELGKMLFFDPRLSGNNHWACATCHNPALAFGDGLPTSLGFGDEKPLGRHASTLYNVAYNQHQFWDGRAASLEEQAKMPIQNPREMNSRPEELIKKLSAIAGYRARFLEVFGEEPTFDNVAKAIATFERTLTSKNSRFDRYVMGEKDALTAQEKRGLILFLSKAACSRCHNGPNFTDDQFHNIALPQVGPLKEDLGRYEVTRQEEDKRAFKTPTLRNSDLTAPYMHNGVFETLKEVMDFYNKGGGEDPLKSEEIFPLHLTEEEQNDVIAFLHSLRGDLQLVAPPLLP
jgi:cytochrome c peroxidase